MKKTKNRKEDVLARAEKFFKRGNFMLAQKEFEKAQKKLKRRDIAAKIEVCRKEAATLKAKELIKRARKAEKKGNLTEALKCFEAASSICSEAWILKRIGLLKNRSTVKDALTAANQAEAAGDFQRAADLYAEAVNGAESVDLHLKRAHCLVKAENYTQATAVFENLPLSDPGSRYDYGLALAKIGRYGDCLHAWEGLETADERFLEQKKTICMSLAADLFDRFAEKKDCAAIYRDARYLQTSAGDCLEPHQIRALEDLLEYAKYAWIQELWDTEKYDTLADLLQTGPCEMTPELLALQAKIWFKLATHDGKHLTAMLLYWITAVYSRQISAGFAVEAAETLKIRQNLIDAAQNLIKQYAGTEYGQRAATYFKIDQKLTQQLLNLAGENKRRAPMVCTPLYAARFGKTANILSLIRNNRDFFDATEDYLEAGAYYSAAAECLYILENGEFENALNLLANLPPKIEEGEFRDYAAKRIHFEYGLYCMQNGDVPLNDFFEAAPAIFDIAPAYEQIFTEKALGIEKWDALKVWEDALAYMNKKRPTEAIRQALSLVMSRRAIAMGNKGELSVKAVKNISKKALQLNPENEMALRAVQDSVINFEVNEIYKALNRFKLAKASRIAQKTEHEEVKYKYFKFVSDIFEDIMASELDHHQKLIMLNELYDWASMVDAGQPLLNEILVHLEMEKAS